MSSPAENQINEKLAQACQATCSSCCKKGKIFLPDAQYLAIRDWVQKNSPGEIEEFESRSEKFDGFYLYDQQDICQFLDERDLCRLHTQGVKPRECFWWPLHVYTGEGDNLDIRVSTSCCTAYQNLSADSPYVDSIERESKQLGDSLIRRFRNVYPGSYSGISLKTFNA
jgi:hypothetical protein